MDPVLEFRQEVDQLKAELAAVQANLATYEAYCHSLENAVLSAYGDQGMDEVRTLRANAGIPLDGRPDLLHHRSA